jgi:hypothetical protein
MVIDVHAHAMLPGVERRLADDPVGHVRATLGLGAADQEAILGHTAATLLGLT